MSLAAVIITNSNEGLAYFGYITLKSNKISGYALSNILFFNNVIFECLAIHTEVIQGHRTLNFYDKYLRNEKN